MVKLYTAHYRYPGKDRLDITVKGKDPVGRIFAPTWKMVMGCKSGKFTDADYTDMYRDLMRISYKEHRAVWEDLLRREETTLVCFCPSGSFCHRYLLAGYLSKLGADYRG